MMRKNIHCKMVAAVLLAALTISSLTACGKKENTGNNSQTTVTQDNGQSSDTNTQEQTTEPATTQEPTTQVEGFVGVSSTGRTIQNIDGITYVDGIMIVNKTYPLPSWYNPGGLSQEALDAFAVMQNDAVAQGLNIWIQSSFRTYDYQAYLYDSYVAADGKAAADTYSARAGHSEHQSGLCFDLNTIEDSFAYTPEGKWVDANAHKYGFIIRFPKGKESITGYKYESWHLRYVGTELATYMYNNNLCLEEYLGVTSQYAD